MEQQTENADELTKGVESGGGDNPNNTDQQMQTLRQELEESIRRMEESHKDLADMRVRAAQLTLQLAAEFDPALQVKLYSLQQAQTQAEQAISANMP